ncbi:MAG: uroporphyrinogen decarboxylase family protein [Bryobacteraceae bacterium]
MNRRAFVSMLPAAAGAAETGITKRQRMERWLEGKPDPAYTPAAFFLHFDKEYKNGLAAARRHLEFFRATDMDFVKIQFEQTYERQAFLRKPDDWAKLALRKVDFYEPLLVTARELVKSAKKDAMVVMTLYSPYMCAGHCATTPLLRAHMAEKPEAVRRGMEILTESQMIFVRGCIEAGVDGFYMSTQGSETGQFADPGVFAKQVRPWDLVAMKEAAAKLPFNILHVCDYHAPYAGFDAVQDYPGQVVNTNTAMAGGVAMSPREISGFFGRPYMGGLDRHGVLAHGSAAEVEAGIRRVVAGAPRQFILGADCTVASETDWARLRGAIDVAHRVGRGA